MKQTVLQSGTARAAIPVSRPHTQRRTAARASLPRRGGPRWPSIVLLIVVGDIALALAVWSIVEHIAK